MLLLAAGLVAPAAVAQPAPAQQQGVSFPLALPSARQDRGGGRGGAGGLAPLAYPDALELPLPSGAAGAKPHPRAAAGLAAAARPALKLQPPPAVALGAASQPRPQAPEHAAGADCLPAWPCRLRLFGVIDKTGGVGLKGPALTW